MSKKANKKLLLIMAVLAIIAAVALVLLLALPKSQPAVPQEPAATEVPQATEIPASSAEAQAAEAQLKENAAPVSVTKTEYELTYSGSMADVISYEEKADTQADDLTFYVQLSDRKAEIFTMTINSDEGDIVKIFMNTNNEQIPVAFSMNVLPEQLGEEDTSLFLRAQEVVNDVVESIVLK